jgi:DNA (cytosine-5)-methyltransferase 1
VFIYPEKDAPICVGYSEIDKYASQVLKYHYPTIKNYGDCKTIDWASVPDFDLLTGGSPCQDFSIAGKRKGITGERSGLVWEYLRCLEEKKPEYFIWENVKGVLSSRRGFDFGNILTAFSEAGYTLWWQVLNAKDFGVPQNRERVFIIGSRSGRIPEVFFERGADSKDTQQPSSNAIDRNYGKGADKHGQRTMIMNMHTSARNPNRKLEHARTIRLGGGKSLDNKHTWDTYMIDGKIRRLTPRECERLMGWPDDWTRWGINDKGEKVEMSDSQRYKMCGNGVVSAVVRELYKII